MSNKFVWWNGSEPIDKKNGLRLQSLMAEFFQLNLWFNFCHYHSKNKILYINP